MEKILNRFIPLNVKPENIKFYNTTKVVYNFGLLSHAVLIGFFYYYDIIEMTLFGLFISVPTFLCAIILNRSGKQNPAFIVGYFELYFHQIFGTYLLGWDVGLQFWLIYLVGLGFLNPTWGRKTQILQIVLFALAFGILFIFFPEGIRVFPEKFINISYVSNGLMSIILLSLLVNRYSRSAHIAEENLKQANAEIKAAHEETRSLLLNILPETIADRLTKDEKQIADHFDNTTIIFCDLAGFTEMSSTRSADEIVALLNGIFYLFDTIVEDLGLEKIKTIGDGYMAASGVPERREDHALAAVNCAIKMLQALKEYNNTNNLELKLRIGINSGPVVAGVIGKNKFTYDLWGDTVNTASRMESHGIPGKIHISKMTYAELNGCCKTEHRGTIVVKGKGEMETFIVQGIKKECMM